VSADIEVQRIAAREAPKIAASSARMQTQANADRRAGTSSENPSTLQNASARQDRKYTKTSSLPTRDP